VGTKTYATGLCDAICEMFGITIGINRKKGWNPRFTQNSDNEVLPKNRRIVEYIGDVTLLYVLESEQLLNL